MKVAQRDCRTPRFSRSRDLVKSSNRLLPPPRMTGATMMPSSSTMPASSPCRITSPPPPMLTSLPPAASFVRSMGDDKDGHAKWVLVAPMFRRLVHVAPDNDRTDAYLHLVQELGVLAFGLAA